MVWKGVDGPAPARAGAVPVYEGQRALSLARLARWDRCGPLWAAMGRYGLQWAAMGRYGPPCAARCGKWFTAPRPRSRELGTCTRANGLSPWPAWPAGAVMGRYGPLWAAGPAGAAGTGAPERPNLYTVSRGNSANSRVTAFGRRYVTEFPGHICAPSKHFVTHSGMLFANAL